MWHATNRWLNILFEAKNQTEVISNFLTPKGPIWGSWMISHVLCTQLWSPVHPTQDRLPTGSSSLWAI